MTSWTASTTPTAIDTSTTPAPGSPHNPRAPLSAVAWLVDYRNGRGSGGITQVQKPKPGAANTPRVPPNGGAWAARPLPKQRQRSVNFNLDVADCSQLATGRLSRFNPTQAYLTVYAGIARLPPGPPIVAERDFTFSGGSRALAISTTVSQAMASPAAGFANTWTVWLQVNGLFQARVDLDPEPKTLLVRCSLPVTIG